MNVELLVGVGGMVGASFKWVWEYTKSQTWQKNKFLIEQLDAFKSLDSTKAMETILDWNAAKISYGDKKVFVTDELLKEAIYTHDIKKKFTNDEFIIRDIIDEYFDSLTRLVMLCEQNLVPKESLILQMRYWFNILKGNTDRSKSREIVDMLNQYMEYYGYTELREFLRRLDG
jgi:hypothetical protein